MATPPRQSRSARKRVQRPPSPPRRERRSLDARERRFVAEYLIDLKPERAAIAAGYSATTAAKKAYSWVGNSGEKPHVFAAVEAALGERSARLAIEADAVLRRWWDLATADARELVEYRRSCCRYCWGVDHRYQWTTERAFQEAAALAARQGEPIPTDDGGYGYRASRDPNPDCPECTGDGVGQMVLRDTRSLSAGAALLYAGTKISKDGVQVLLEDRAAALANVARHLGMLDPKLTLKGDKENPLQVLFAQMSGATLRPVVDDPEIEGGA